MRYTASLAGVTTNKEYKKQLGEKQQKMRQIKEKTEATLESTIEKTGDVLTATKDKVTDTVQREPVEDTGRHRQAS